MALVLAAFLAALVVPTAASAQPERSAEGFRLAQARPDERPPARPRRDDPPAAPSAPVEVPTGDEGWWVVMAAFPKPLPQPDPVPKVTAAAVKCGIRTFSTSSDDFGEFKPGFIVVVSGAYPSRGAAEEIAQKARPCIPEASVKFSPHDGG